MKAKARAVVKSVAKHRVFFLFVMGLFTVGLLAGSYAIQSGATFSGQTRAGDHEFWQDITGDGFCANCHTGIGADLIAGPHRGDPAQSTCSTCHTAGSADHAAAAAQCTDCHDNRVDELNSPTEAHTGILTSLGEGLSPPTGPGASQTCQACHTHAEVTMAITPDVAIPLQMGG